jgi:pectate lyase
MFQNNLNVIGNATINGNTNISILNVSNTIISNGNTIIYGNLGIGINPPQYPLDVAGNARVVGQFTNSNYDTIQILNNYNKTWVDLNTLRRPLIIKIWQYHMMVNINMQLYIIKLV